jgi:hypothetical protein
MGTGTPRGGPTDAYLPWREHALTPNGDFNSALSDAAAACTCAFGRPRAGPRFLEKKAAALVCQRLSAIKNRAYAACKLQAVRARLARVSIAARRSTRSVST